MSHESDIRHGRHCVYRLHVHLVFVTKYRRRVFDARAIDVLRGIFADVCADAQATLVEMDGEDDHVHLLVEYPPKAAAAVVSLCHGPWQASVALVGIPVLGTVHSLIQGRKEKSAKRALRWF